MTSTTGQLFNVGNLLLVEVKAQEHWRLNKSHQGGKGD